MIVVIELGLLPFVIAGMAVGPVAGTVFAAPDVVLGRPLDVIRDDQIQPAVLVVIKPSCTGRPPPGIGNTALRRNISERPVAVIVVEDGASVTGHIQVGKAVIIEVRNRNTLPVMPFTPNPGFASDVSESFIAIIVV